MAEKKKTENEQEFGADEAVYRGMPTAFENNDDEQTFTLNELEGDIDRGLGPSSDYEPRSVQVASYREENLSFVEAFSSAAHTKQYVDTSIASFFVGIPGCDCARTTVGTPRTVSFRFKHT